MTSQHTQAIVAFDLSLTAPGWAGPQGSGVLSPPRASTLAEKARRITWIVEQCVGLVEEVEQSTNGNTQADGNESAVAVEVVVEGPSYNSRGNQGVSIGEMHGVFKHEMTKRGNRVTVVPPATLKKYATGKGNASKIEMIVAARERFGFDVLDDNEADARLLRALGLELRGVPAITVPKSHIQGLADKVETLESGGGTAAQSNGA